MKKIVKAMISTVVLLIFTGCAWKVPETISVKTDADYEFSLGTFEKELDQEMDINTLMGDAGKNKAEILLYDYFPGKKEKNIQHFLLEVELLKYSLLDGATALAAYDAASLAAGHPVEELTLNSGGLTTGAIPPEDIGLDFNPSSLFSGLKSALGSDLAGKIVFEDPILLYFYCEATEGMTADANLSMFYGDKSTPINKHTADVSILSGTIANTPRPVYEKDGNTIITDLEEETCLGGKSINIKDLINSTDPGIKENDQLCMTYSLSNMSGTIKKEDAKNGITIKVYAIIDLPLRFKVTDKVVLDVKEMTKNGSSSSSSSKSGDSENDEFSKIIDVIDTVTIRYTAYKLPFYSVSGMQLGIDMLGDGSSFQYAPISTSEKIKNSISLYQTTIMKMKENPSFNPNIQLIMEKDTVFSLPREKAVSMNIEMGIKTDGIIKLK